LQKPVKKSTKATCIPAFEKVACDSLNFSNFYCILHLFDAEAGGTQFAVSPPQKQAGVGDGIFFCYPTQWIICQVKPPTFLKGE
jgi:hypothetical protein